jgi:predicted dithiol-disulfide oxidoreductase (DUF899 family)
MTPATELKQHPIATPERWLEQRRTLLAREKELTRMRDELAAERRALPWVRVDKPYTFETPQGRRSLAELFDGRRQLVVQHFMFAPGWEAGCKSCSFMADHVDGTTLHLAQRDVSFVAISRAPLAEIERFRQRMGWQFRWASSHGTAFNHDFGVSFTPEQRAQGEVFYNYAWQAFPLEEAPGISAFVRDEAGQVFHTYSTYGRGVELMMGTYDVLDITAKGRDEAALDYTMAWVRHHDRYETSASPKAAAGACCASTQA